MCIAKSFAAWQSEYFTAWEVPRPGIFPDQDDARQQAADFNVTFNQHGQRDQADRREVSPPIEVESAT